MRDEAMFPDLGDASVLITGGGTGIGAKLTEGFARQGSRVAFIDIAAAQGRELAARIGVETGITPLFPLWGSDTTELAQQMMAAGLRARVCTLDPKTLDMSLGGHEFDESLLAALPAGVDPCGENGEFHTLAWDGPMFQRPLAIRVGETVLRDGFVFTDLLADEIA